jgi:hypothetical protein
MDCLHQGSTPGLDLFLQPATIIFFCFEQEETPHHCCRLSNIISAKSDLAPAHNLAQHIVKEHGILLMAEHQPALVRIFWTKHWCGDFFGQIGRTNAGFMFNINKDRPSISLHPNSDPCNYLPDINTPYVKLPWT